MLLKDNEKDSMYFVTVKMGTNSNALINRALLKAGRDNTKALALLPDQFTTIQGTTRGIIANKYSPNIKHSNCQLFLISYTHNKILIYIIVQQVLRANIIFSHLTCVVVVDDRIGGGTLNGYSFDPAGLSKSIFF